MTQPAAPRPGWYADPEVPGRDRWWTGMSWSEHTAKTDRSNPAYARAMRAGVDSVARAGQVAFYVVLALALVFAISRPS
ncbi:DUF2510 domain-containing protein [Schumannella luteola]